VEPALQHQAFQIKCDAICSQSKDW